MANSLTNSLTRQILSFLLSVSPPAFAWRANTLGVYDPRRGLFRTAPKKGVSDILGCWRGILLAIEIKTGSDRLSPEQEGFLKNIIHSGGIAFVARDFDSFSRQWRSIVIFDAE